MTLGGSQKGTEMQIKQRKNKAMINVKRHYTLSRSLLPTAHLEMKF